MAVTHVAESSVAPSNGVRIALFFLGAMEHLKSAPAIGVLLDDDPGVPGATLGGFVISGTIVLIPIAALAAAHTRAPWPHGSGSPRLGSNRHFGLAQRSHVSRSALGLLPSSGIIGALELVRFIAFPLLATAAVVLATRRRWLGPATMCVAIPTIFDILGVIAFGVGIAIYGF